MNQFYKKALDAVAKEAIGAAGRYAGNLLLDSLTKEGQDETLVLPLTRKEVLMLIMLI